jgi:rhamnosyltransferase
MTETAMGYSVDAVILTYRPGEEFFEVIRRLEKQKTALSRIIIMNTGEEYLNDKEDILSSYKNVDVHHITKADFNHGKTRNDAAGYSSADFIIFMTMDALPADKELVGELIKPFEDPEVSVSYARQLPKKRCGAIESYNRAFNYPEGDVKKGRDDMERLGIKTFFCSNVCACYRRKTFDELGGFTYDTLFNEDMIYASKAVKAGYKIYYASSAKVYHSHDYTISQQYHRNFDLGVSQAEHPEVFSGISSENEGMKLVKGCAGYLLKTGKAYLLPEFVIKCAARYLGYKQGINYKKLSEKRVLKMTTDPDYFKNRC